jgi:hypothetical protein
MSTEKSVTFASRALHDEEPTPLSDPLKAKVGLYHTCVGIDGHRATDCNQCFETEGAVPSRKRSGSAKLECSDEYSGGHGFTAPEN